MYPIVTNEKHIKAEIFTDLINDRQAKIIKFKIKHPEYSSQELTDIEDRLAMAHREARIAQDNEHFKLWETLISLADDILVQSQLNT